MSAFSSLPPGQQDAILNSPALSPPAGVVPNFSDPPNFNAGCYAITSVCLVISTICVLTRLYTKFFLIKRLRIEDYLLIAAYGIYLGMIYCMYGLAAGIGFQVHQWDIPLKDLSRYLYVLHICANLHPTFILISKTAILLDWIHIFVPNGTRNFFFWTCRFLLFSTVIAYAAMLFVDNLICSPIQVLWDPFAEGSCFSRLSCAPLEALWNAPNNRTCRDPRTVMRIYTSTINLTSNFFILILPQRVIWKLHMPSKNKIGVSIAFTMGIVAIVASCFRVASASQLSSKDLTYVSASLLIWSLVEMTCSFLILCAPVAPRAWKSFRTLGDTSVVRPWVRTRSNPTIDELDPPWAPIRKALHKGPDYRKIDYNTPHAEKSSPSWPVDQDHGIMRTNEITSTIEDRSDSMVADQFVRIHPWAAER
ncbi:hypothetical protein F4818DRAFT_433856 [Hypoxylon cercidicola]|nr:hypothetical protein F4818DRAFT_433856 [Hypoxylon cercidicola]